LQIEVNLIDTNDNDPEFMVDTYLVSVLENCEQFTNVVTVKAADNDKGKYGIISYR